MCVCVWGGGGYIMQFSSIGKSVVRCPPNGGAQCVGRVLLTSHTFSPALVRALY